MFTYFFLTLALTALSTNAENQTSNSTIDESTCGVPGGYDYVNATGNLVVPGFAPLGWDPRNWTLHFGLKDIRNATANSNREVPLMWISSSASDDHLDSPELPYIGCLVRIVYEKRKKSTGSISQGDGCKGVYSEKCFNALQERVKNAAIAQSRGGGRNTTISGLCMDMVEFDMNNCENEEHWNAMGSTQMFGNGTYGTNGTDGCGDPGVAANSIVRTGTGPVFVKSNDYGNFTDYDFEVNSTTPYMLIAWGSNKSNTKNGWGDARLVCPTIDQFEKGSRVPQPSESPEPTEPPKSGAGSLSSPDITVLLMLLGGVMTMSL